MSVARIFVLSAFFVTSLGINLSPDFSNLGPAQASASGIGRPLDTSPVYTPPTNLQAGKTECLTDGAAPEGGVEFSEEERENHIARFLIQATFGPSLDDIANVDSVGFCQWLINQYKENETLSPDLSLIGNDFRNSFWLQAGPAKDQLRQRMSFALSQIIVVSDRHPDLQNAPEAMSHYVDILTRNALGNYADLLEDITLSPAMAVYLTYLNNRKSSSSSTRGPDENYAREIMQLFTIGTIMLNGDGTPLLDANGNTIDTYDNDDVKELANIFTGMHLDGQAFGAKLDEANAGAGPSRTDLTFRVSERDTATRTFLNKSVGSGGGLGRVRNAIKILMDHPNTAPFVSRQLIQRFVTSAPRPGYVEYVANAFTAGQYEMPDGRIVGTGEKGDLMATISAILLHPQARLLYPGAHRLRSVPIADLQSTSHFGKFREPTIRLMNWARAFGVTNFNLTVVDSLYPNNSPRFIFDELTRGLNFGQDPHSASSVFNFYRPGFVARVGTGAAAVDLTLPELQIINENTLIGIMNVIENFILQLPRIIDPGDPFFTEYFDLMEITPGAENTSVADYTDLIRRIDLLLTGGVLNQESRILIEQALVATGPPGACENIPEYVAAEDGVKFCRVRLAVYMVANSTEHVYSR